jgi:DNA repair protein SbcC/Rad50
MSEIYDKSLVRIGSRALSEEQAELLLPSFKSILLQVEKFRQHTALLNEIIRYGKHQNNQIDVLEDNYNNVISILGGRGSGKTSILLTLKKYFRTNASKDIILPMIVPEYIGKTTDTLGWILGYLGDEIKIIEEMEKDSRYKTSESHKYYENSQYRYSDDRLKENYNKLCQTYFFRKKSYNDYINVKNEGTADYIRDKQLSMRSDQLLIKQFKEFIDLIIAKKRILNNHADREPLLMLFFDDVDISSERCCEVLDVIRMYLTHKSIVVFVSGEYNTFAEALTLDFLQREKIPDIHYNEEFVPRSREELLFGLTTNKTVLQTRIQLSQEYLKKTLPPSFRHEMQALNNQDKMSFRFDNQSKKTLCNLIIERLAPENSKLKLSPYHFDFFDTNPRGLINIYYYLDSLEVIETEEERLENIKGFLKILLETSPKLKEYSYEVNKYILINSKDKSAKVDFSLIKSLSKNISVTIKEKINNKVMVSKTDLISDIINLFILGDLISRLINENSTNKNLLFAEIINQINGNLLPYIKPSNNNKNLIHRQKTKENEILDFLVNFIKEVNKNINSDELSDLFQKRENKNYSAEKYYFETLIAYYNQYTNRKNLEEVDILFEFYNHDENWVRNKVDFSYKIAKNDYSLITRVKNQVNKFFDTIPEIKDFLYKDQQLFDIFHNNEMIIELQKNLIMDINQIGKGNIKSFLFSQEIYSYIEEVSRDIKRIEDLKTLSSTLDYILSEIHEEISSYISRKFVFINENDIEIINNFLERFHYNDVIYIDYIQSIRDSGFIDYDKFIMFIDSLEKRAYEVTAKYRRDYIVTLDELRKKFEQEHDIVETNRSYFLEVDSNNKDLTETLMLEVKIYIELSIQSRIIEIEKRRDLNYFFDLNNRLYYQNADMLNSSSKIKRNKYKKDIMTIQGVSYANN